MDTTNTQRLTQRERIELQSKIQRLQWLLKECIGIEEYELCSQIKAIIQSKSAILNENPSTNE
jgi:protein-arginine kinase activator protein McsA